MSAAFAALAEKLIQCDLFGIENIFYHNVVPITNSKKA